VPRPDRDQSWVRELGARREFGFTDQSTSNHLRYELAGDLGVAGQNRPWTCSISRHFLDDGGAENSIDWTCPSLIAADAQKELIVSVGTGASLGSGEAVGDLALLGLGTATAFFRGRRRSPEELLVTDVLTVCSVQDPNGILTGTARETFAHWPVLDDPPPRWVQSVRRVMRAQELPADAPPPSLAVSMTAHTPLTIGSRDWWQRGSWLEHQIDLGLAIGRAVVSAGSCT
jgi:hypothetical protein